MKQEVADRDLETVARTFEGFDHHESFKKHACGKWDNCKRSVPLASQLVLPCLHVHATGRPAVGGLQSNWLFHRKVKPNLFVCVFL